MESISFKEEEWIDRKRIDISLVFNKILESNIKLVEIRRNEIKFVYVGVIVYKKEILIVLPKYFNGLFSSEIECILL